MKLYLEPGSINCTCCPDISTCNNLEQTEETMTNFKYRTKITVNDVNMGALETHEPPTFEHMQKMFGFTFEGGVKTTKLEIEEIRQEFALEELEYALEVIGEARPISMTSARGIITIRNVLEKAIREASK
jgi:hypothetical protein